MKRDVESRCSKVQGLINTRKAVDAVILSLENPPVSSKNETTKMDNKNSVFAALGACNKTDMKQVMEKLSVEEQDTLMKYLFARLAMPANNALFLEWHALLSKKAGDGCSVRALTDRKTV